MRPRRYQQRRSSVRRERRPVDGPDGLGVTDTSQLHAPRLDEVDVAPRFGDLLHQRRGEDLARAGQGTDTGGDHDVLAEQVALVVDQHFTRVQAHAYAQLVLRRAPRSAHEVSLYAD